jgi:hypothetical protein
MKKLLLICGILFVGFVAACATTSNYYTKVSRVSLIETGVSINKHITTLYLTVANPTTERKHFILHCCIPSSPNDCLSDWVLVVPPRSDKNVTVRVTGSITCELIPNKVAHE